MVRPVGSSIFVLFRLLSALQVIASVIPEIRLRPLGKRKCQILLERDAESLRWIDPLLDTNGAMES
jgi:hypothetical protein